MNLCILLGKIASEIEFKFIIKGKNKSIAYFDLLLLNKSVVRVKAYNEMADYIYRKFNKGQIVMVEGKLRQDGVHNSCVELCRTIFLAKCKKR